MRASWAFTLLFPGLGSAACYALGPWTSGGYAAFWTVKSVALLWPLAWLAARPAAARPPVGPPALSRSAVAWGAGSGLVIAALLLGAARLADLDALLGPHVPAMRRAMSAIGSLERYVLYAAVVSVAHSLLEEYYWRWFARGLLEPALGPAPALWAAAAGFALHHAVIAAFVLGPGYALLVGLGTGAGGAAWSWLYRRSGSLVAPWISHLLADAALFAAAAQILI